MRSNSRFDVFFVSVVTLSMATPIGAETFRVDFDSASPTQYLDRWMYPFNVTPGMRIQAPTFGAVGSEGFDERDGQFLIAVDTASIGVPAGLASSSYQIERLTLTVTEATGGYQFDASQDGYQTYLPDSSAKYAADEDAGRPIELFGVGFRNDFETYGWPDGSVATEAPRFSAGSPFGPPGSATRNVFAADATGHDVSNSVDALSDGVSGFDPDVFAIGQAFVDDMSLAPGAEVPANTQMIFDVDIENAAIRNYLQNGLASGTLGLMITSLHATGQLGEGDPFVNLATANHFAVAGPILELEVSIQDSIRGDFDQSGDLAVDDIDLLTASIAGPFDETFDLDENGALDARDLSVWIDEIFGSDVGDANLDGQFDDQDFVVVFIAGEYNDSLVHNSTWSTGDWNGDREFTSDDIVAAFTAGGYLAGPRGAYPVPEAHGMIILGMAIYGAARCRQRRNRTR